MQQKLKLKKSQKSKISQTKKELIVVVKSKPAQRLALHAVQKHLQVLRLKEYLLLIGFTLSGAFLRIPMQEIPSAEPITFFAILAGWLFGRKKGFLVGASAGYISNFFMFGGQGPWTPFQMLGWGIAGFLGGFLRKNSRIWSVIIVTLIATLAFEVIMNSVTPFMMGGNIFVVFLLALPFTLVHITSNLIFCLFLPFAKKLILEKGGFDDKEMCLNIINRFKHKFSWLSKRTTK